LLLLCGLVPLALSFLRANGCVTAREGRKGTSLGEDVVSSNGEPREEMKEKNREVGAKRTLQ
jgi:hypothetical protein